MLHRYWFVTVPFLGLGVTAYSLADAEALLRTAGLPRPGQTVLRVVEDVDIRTLDADHIRPNMHPPNWRGIWYPFGYWG